VVANKPGDFLLILATLGAMSERRLHSHKRKQPFDAAVRLAGMIDKAGYALAIPPFVLRKLNSVIGDVFFQVCALFSCILSPSNSAITSSLAISAAAIRHLPNLL
jgi:hypothetical protein